MLAGDQDRTQGPPLAEPDWGLQRFSPLPQYAGWPVPVLFLPGNHEYDGRDWDDTHRALRATCERLGQIWLEREVWKHCGVRFVGTTLWSDYGTLPQHPRDRLYRAANFHLYKMAIQRRDALFDAADRLPLADVWMHGHLHCPQDQRVGRCRFVANPLGYASKGEQAAFAPTACVSVPDQSAAAHGARTLQPCNILSGNPQ